MIGRLWGLLRWIFWWLIGGGWCLDCRKRLWAGPRSKYWIPPIFCPHCHGLLRLSAPVRPRHFTRPPASVRPELEAAAGIVEDLLP